MPTHTSKAKLFKATSSFVITLLLLSLLSISIPTYSYAADDSQYFPETKHTLSGKFLEYWRVNGGLATYGYPITEAQNEVSKTDGKTYLTQWFERNRFELHPENIGSKNEVQLGLLGRELRGEARLADPDFKRTEQLLDPALPAEQQWYFEETGHNLRFRFLQYWMQNGGLARFGYPISEEHPELDQASGKVFLMQWFERARFELHPENRPPNDVLLGLLGNQIKKPTSPVEFMWKLGNAYSAAWFFSGLAVDPNGYSYVADSGRLFKYGPDGKLVNWWENAVSSATDDGSGRFLGSGVALDKEQNVYVAYQDSTNPGVRKYDPTGKLLQHIGSSGSGNGQFYHPIGVALDKDNNLYVAEGDTAGDNEARVQKFDSTGRFLLSFGEGKDQDSSPLSNEAVLKHPTGLATDSQNNVYVVASDKHVIKKFDSQGNFLLSFGSIINYDPYDAKARPEPKDGEFGLELFVAAPAGVGVDSQDNVYVTDPVHQRIQKFDSTGNFVAKFKYTNTRQHFTTAIALDSHDNLYVTDGTDGLVRKFDPNGTLLLEYGAKIDPKNPFAGERTPFGFSLSSFTLDEQGNFYFSSYIATYDKLLPQHFIYKYNPSGQLLYLLELPQSKNPAIRDPALITVDRKGNLYISDPADSTIQKLDGNGKFLFKFGREGSDANQVAPDRSPSELVVDASGNIYVLGLQDPYTIQKFDPNGKFLFKFGSKGSDPSQPVPMLGLRRLRLDPQGNLYVEAVEDSGNKRIQKFDRNGHFLFSVGEFPILMDSAVDSQGNLYVHNIIDNEEARTRTPVLHKFDPNGKLVFTHEFGTYSRFEEQHFSLRVDGQDNLYLFWAEFANIASVSSYRLEKYDPSGQLLFTYRNKGLYDGEFKGGSFYLDQRGYFYLVDIMRIDKFRLR